MHLPASVNKILPPSLQHFWDSVRDAAPGQRFQQCYLRHRRHRRSRAQTAAGVATGIAILLTGVVLLPAPGPGSIIVLLGAALLARQSWQVARAADWMELRCRGVASKIADRWRQCRLARFLNPSPAGGRAPVNGRRQPATLPQVAIMPCQRPMWICGLLLLTSSLLQADPPPALAPSKATPPLPDLALQPPQVLTEFGPDHVKSSRGAQGVPTIERSPNGRLWAAWYAGKGKRGVESPFSYVVLANSSDDGRSWTEKLILQAPLRVHTYDPCLWIDPQRRLWLFWAQSAGLQDGRMGVWGMIASSPDAADPTWSAPRRIANGVMLNKPTVLANGHWLLCAGLWRDSTNVPNIALKPEVLAPYTEEMLKHDLGEERGSNVYRSADQGRTFERIGQVRVPGTRPDEHMIVERRDGSLWMLLRNTGGIAQSVSSDGGRTWSSGSLFLAGGKFANKRFFIRRLQSGALLMVRNDAPTSARSHLTAFASDDDGLSWHGGLLLDERESSYPDGVQAADGTIYVIYDHQRYTLNRDGKEGVGSVVMAVFQEEDVRAARPITTNVRMRVVVSQLR